MLASPRLFEFMKEPLVLVLKNIVLSFYYVVVVISY